MQLKDVTPIIKAILEERDKIPRIIDHERYPFEDGPLICGKFEWRGVQKEE